MRGRRQWVSGLAQAGHLAFFVFREGPGSSVVGLAALGRHDLQRQSTPVDCRGSPEQERWATAAQPA